MLILVEGVDGAGKTTLVNELAHYGPDNTVVRHCGPLRRSAWVEYMQPLHEHNVRRDFLIADRWHVGEMVYGPLYRGASKVDDNLRDTVELALDRLGAVKLIVLPPLEVVQKRLLDRGEDFLQQEHVEQVYLFYKAYADLFNWTVVGDEAVTNARSWVIEARARSKKVKGGLA